jgi:hypothetical protein
MEMPTDPAILAQMKLAFSSFLGAAIRLFLRPVEGFSRAVFCVVCSVACGWAFTETVLLLFNLDEVYAGGVGAALGTIGLSIAESVIRGFEKIELSSIISSWFKKS